MDPNSDIQPRLEEDKTDSLQQLKINLKRDVQLGSKEGKYLFMALIIMFYTIARLLGVGVHEFAGHGLFTELVGGEFYAAYISPGNGFASIYLPDGTSQSIIALTYLAGIIVELIVGSILLFIVYPRMKNLMPALFTLVMSEILLVHSSLYLVLGSYIPSGDTYRANIFGGIAMDIMVVSGLILASVSILIISMKFIQFITNFEVIKDDNSARRALGLFWLPPVMIVWTSIIISFVFPGEMEATSDEQAYSLIYGSLVLMLILIAMNFTPQLTTKKFDFLQREGVRLDKVVKTLGVLLLTVVLWLAIFGPSSTEAHGLMIKDPPLESEVFYQDYVVGNALIELGDNGTIEVSIMLKGVMEDPMPLDQKLYDSFDDRPNWSYYENASRNMMKNMFLLTSEETTNLTFENYVSGEVWGGGELYRYARVSKISVNLSDIGFDLDAGGNLTILAIDPWMVGRNPGYLDGMEFRWGDDYNITNYDTGNIQSSGGGMDEGSLVWRNPDFSSAPTGYRVNFVKNDR